MQVENARRHTYNRMTRKQNNLGARYGNENNIIEKPNRSSKWEKSYRDSTKIQRRKYTLISSEQHSKKYQTRKSRGHDGIHGFGFKKFTSIHDKLAIEMKRFFEETDIC